METRERREHRDLPETRALLASVDLLAQLDLKEQR